MPAIPLPGNAANTVWDLLGRFSDALATLSVAHHSLAAKEISQTGDEEVVLRQALDALRSVYQDLDVSSGRFARPEDRRP